jgi:esterase/lipase superfamily enzyme
VVAALRPRLAAGQRQLYCLDGVDAERSYCQEKPPAARIGQHLQYALEEVLPLTHYLNPDACPLAAVCSMGAFHAVNFTFRPPQLSSKVVGLSGRYDLAQATDCFRDLFQGYVDE